MTYEEYRKRWARLSLDQRARVEAKARWEHMGLWAVLEEWWANEDPEPLED